eukprot:TRINITY_DN665_c0_g1_i1.p2 TRINITY_DN665_c0_g1~~TRINITY_DN665_c0_g1_i1.p2  ORF type:complete len:200 (-),score=37.93 TRINITY_DN665_c0_g1_i1:388-951(-)
MKEKLGISFKLEKRPYSAPMKARPVAIRQERHDPQVQPPSQNSGPQGALGPALELLRSVTEITSRSQPIQKDEPITQEEKLRQKREMVKQKMKDDLSRVHRQDKYFADSDLSQDSAHPAWAAKPHQAAAHVSERLKRGRSELHRPDPIPNATCLPSQMPEKDSWTRFAKTSRDIIREQDPRQAMDCG